MLEVQEVKDKSQWQEFVEAAAPRTFLQHWQWGKFHEGLGQKSWQLGIFAGEELRGEANILKITAKRGSFLFLPHVFISKQEHWQVLIPELRKIARQEGCSFVRVSPLLEDNEDNRGLFSKLGFRSAPMHMHSELGWILDLAPSEEELLKNMRKSTRYNIRAAQKAGAKIIKSGSAEDVETFNQLYQATVQEKGFVPFSKKYLAEEFSSFGPEGMAQWFLARYNGEVLSAALVIFSKNSGFYHQGANTRAHPKVPASALLQWEAIREAKARGCKEYNFWGVSPEDESQHPWAGTTKFKKGFGGFQENYVHAQDLVLTPKYWLNWAVETARRIKRGY